MTVQSFITIKLQRKRLYLQIKILKVVVSDHLKMKKLKHSFYPNQRSDILQHRQNRPTGDRWQKL